MAPFQTKDLFSGVKALFTSPRGGSLGDTSDAAASGNGSVIGILKMVRDSIVGGLTIAGFNKAYDPINDMLKVSSMQKKFRDSFVGAAIDTTKWDVVTGSGASVNIAAGQLTILAGTAINSETILTSKEMFTIPMRGLFGLSLSQRIANQEFYVELVSVDPATGIADGKHCAAWMFDGTSATSAKYRVQNGSMTPSDLAATIATSATMSVFEIESFADECWFHQRTMDSESGRTLSKVRHQQIPDPNASYKIRIRSKNLGSAPASNTSFIFQFSACMDYAELTAEITASRGAAAAGQSLPVQVANTPSVSLSGSANQVRPAAGGTTWYSTGTTGIQVATATSSRVVFGVCLTAGTDAAQVTLYNATSATAPQIVLKAPANTTVTFTPAMAMAFASGIWAVSTGTTPSITVLYA